MLSHKGLVPLFILLIASGCRTDSEARKEALGGATTISAIGAAAVLMPIIPFTAGYSAISESNERKRDKLLYEKLDPVYEQRIEMIQARSPQADVAIVWDEGTRAFLPTDMNIAYCPGIDSDEYRPGLIVLQLQTNQSPLFTYLQTLLEDDPLQKEVSRFNQPIRDFIHTRGEYEAAFNREMHKKFQAAKAATK